jgi:twitching motility protein PilI
MANREALRDLQSRLAHKLEVAKTTTVSASWLAVEAAGGHFLFPLRQSGEIFPLPALQPVAYTQDWFLGVASLRGGLYGVVDFGGYLGAASGPASSAIAASEARLVTLNGLLELNCALLVDRLGGLRNPEAFSAQDPPPAGAPAYFGHCYTDAAGLRWQEINLQLLCTQERFVQISA